MSRRWMISLGLGALAACQTGTETSQRSDTTPSFIISDATHSNGNPNFFWLPPMVPDPSKSPTWKANQFNPNLQPTVYICYLGTVQPSPSASCAQGYTQNFPWSGTNANAGVIVRSSDQIYQVNWPVPNAAVNSFYRIFALIGPFGQAGTITLGYADLEGVVVGGHLAILKDLNSGLAVTLTNGQILPIQFRIQNGALCVGSSSFCTSATVDLTTGGTVKALSGGNPVGLSVPGQGGGAPTVTLTVQHCSYGNRLRLLGTPVDLPVFGSCISITSSPRLTSVLPNAATVFVCDYPPDVSGLSVQQQDFVALHAAHNDWTNPAPFAEVLPEASINCGSIVQAPQQGLKAVFASLWHGEWKTAGNGFLNLIGPRPLAARMRMRRVHLGGGGKTGLQSDFQFALPAKMQISAGSGGSAPPGSIVTASVLVTDLFNQPVRNAIVHFAVTGGGGSVSSPAALSDAEGRLSVQWTLGPGQGVSNTLGATGFGIASAEMDGPRPTFDPFMPTYLAWGDASDPTGSVLLRTGILTFTVLGTTSP